MFTRALRKKNKASIFMEYAIMLGAIAMVFVAMNTYVKRGYQARLKDMTDYFVGTEQADTQDSEAKTESKTNVEQEATLNKRGLGEGRTVMDLTDSTKTGLKSTTMVPEDPNYVGHFLDVEHTAVAVVPIQDQQADEETINNQVREAERQAYEQEIAKLSAQRDQDLALARGKRDQAAALRAEAAGLLRQAQELRKYLEHNVFIRQEERQRILLQIRELTDRAAALNAQAKELSDEARGFEAEASLAQQQIDSLQNRLNQAG